MDSKLFVFECTVKACESEYVQNIMTTVCTCYKVIKSAVGTHYKLIRTTVCTCYKIINPTVCTHYKLIITTVCTCYKVINSAVGTQSHSPSFSSLALQLVFFLTVTSHFITIFFFHIQNLWMIPHL
jgi:hypothetical protein